MSYQVRPIEFEDQTPDLNAICTKCSELSGVDICANEGGIYVCDIPDKFTKISIDKKKITLSGFHGHISPFINDLVTNYLKSIGGKTSVEIKPLKLPTTVDDILEYDEGIQQEWIEAYPVIRAHLVTYAIMALSVIGAILFGLYKILF